MNDSLIQTKKRLTIIFSVIVFCLILFLGLVFFTGKYYKESQFEKNDFSSFINFIEDERFDINDFGTLFQRIRRNKFEKGVNIGMPIEELEEIKDKRGFRPENFINFILVDRNKKVIASEIKDEVSSDLVESVLSDDKYFEIRQEGEFLVKKIFIQDSKNTIILFKNLRYSLDEYFEDILGFIASSILFSILLYIVGYSFVDKTLKPIEANIKDMKDFIHNVGHELKTPLSVIDSNIQLINDVKTYDKEMTMELKNEVIRLNSLIDSLINLTNIDSLKFTEDVNLKDSLNEIIKEFKQKITEKNIEVKVSLTKSVIIKANRDYLFVFLSNIIGNAIKYNIDNGKIDISYKAGELTIKDSGIGINKDELEKIFDRFYKADKSRNSEGFGIGLSLVKKISLIYNWKIKIESDDGKGTKFIVKF
ncbi:hypothetical protein EOM39_07525 [Candidatus Gracilibacteria bacterium]|nr:hypothetical protein [Candidatus Gracilibacteria bacterium]